MRGCEIRVMRTQLLKLTVNHQSKCMLVTSEPSPVASQKTLSYAEVSSNKFLSSLPFRRHSCQAEAKMKHQAPNNLKKTLTKSFKLLHEVPGEDGSYLNFSSEITSGHNATTLRLMQRCVPTEGNYFEVDNIRI